MSTLTREMVLNRTRLLATITLREMAAVAGLYERSETAAAYVEAAALLNDEFDTGGTPKGFCPHCEHAPCVADHSKYGLQNSCGRSPRELSLTRLTYPIFEARRCLTVEAAAVYEAMVGSVHTLYGLAFSLQSRPAADLAVNELVRIRDNIRRVVAS